MTLPQVRWGRVECIERSSSRSSVEFAGNAEPHYVCRGRAR